MADEVRPIIIIKRIKKVSGGAHGGAWKVAYADFVTAMMAFFMLLWLLNSTSQEQKEGLADYFTPTTSSTSSESGAGDILGGTSLNSDGAQSSAVSVSIPTTTTESKDQSTESSSEDDFADIAAKKEQDYFEQMAEDLKIAIQESPELAELEDQVLIDITEEGMRIQLVDKDNRAMFRPGTANLYKYAEKVISKIATVVMKMPNRISISGHTDASAFTSRENYSNWELSADRANASRRVLTKSSVTSNRIAEVLGMAATDPLLPDNPLRPENRRITILLLRESPTLPPGFM